MAPEKEASVYKKSFDRKPMNNNSNPNEEKFEERVLQIKRTTKKTSGGSKIGFSALILLGNKKGMIGTGLGKAPDVQTAVQKAVSAARRAMVKVNVIGDSIAYPIEEKYGSARIILKPAPIGSGIIAGGSVRTVVELVGIKNISGKMLGSNNKICNVMCTINALKKLRA